MSPIKRPIDLRTRVEQALATFAVSAAWLRESLGDAASPSPAATAERRNGEYELAGRVEEDLT